MRWHCSWEGNRGACSKTLEKSDAWYVRLDWTSRITSYLNVKPLTTSETCSCHEWFAACPPPPPPPPPPPRYDPRFSENEQWVLGTIPNILSTTNLCKWLAGTFLKCRKICAHDLCGKKNQIWHDNRITYHTVLICMYNYSVMN